MRNHSQTISWNWFTNCKVIQLWLGISRRFLERNQLKKFKFIDIDIDIDIFWKTIEPTGSILVWHNYINILKDSMTVETQKMRKLNWNPLLFIMIHNYEFFEMHATLFQSQLVLKFHFLMMKIWAKMLNGILTCFWLRKQSL